nr:hypothetical protein [uncultured Cohaesibacter sp.]
MHAFAGSCGLPTLRRTPSFGGHILSHDYVEAALWARAGWRVQDDETITGSHEQGPENIIEYAKRDRRWCQGKLQQARVIPAPGLHSWSRFTLPNGIMTYVSSLLWFLFIALSIADDFVHQQTDPSFLGVSPAMASFIQPDWAMAGLILEIAMLLLLLNCLLC